MNKLLAVLRPFLSVLLFLVPISAGGLLLWWAVANRAQPEVRKEKEVARSLRIIQVNPSTIVPKVVGFGESAPSNTFQAVAEVKGKIIELHPELKSGSFIRAGELLVAIDETDIAINIEKLEAEIARSQASVQELNATKENFEKGLEIEQSSLQLALRELERMEKLYSQNRAVSGSEVDTQRRSVLAQQQSVQNLQSSLNLLPAQIQSAEASIAVSNANLASSKRDLDRCQILAPFNCRVGAVDLEKNEVVSVGQQLFTAQAIDKLEIEAQFGLDKIANLIRPNRESPRFVQDLTVDPQELLRRFFNVDVTIRYGAGDVRTSRKASFERLREQLDPQARTVGIVVSVDLPYQAVADARRSGPPPVPGTYCEVELRGKPIEDSFIIPRAAIRESTVFVVDADDRLRIREVEIRVVQNDLAAVSGLNTGDKVVVSDPTPAIEGMLVEPILDEDLARQLLQEAGGEK